MSPQSYRIRRYGIVLSALVAIAMLMSSCATKRSPLPYFMDIDNMAQNMPIPDITVKIEPSDELFITVTSSSPEATAAYNLPQVNPATTSAIGTASSAREQTYIVNADGNINFPVLGTIHVAGMTIEQLENFLLQRIGADVEDPVVKVELTNFKVNVAGEVKNPGQIIVKTRRVSVLDALTAAGDLTEYGERKNVLVIREENGLRSYGRIDLNSAESMNSPYFYLKQNDYVYVEPNRIRVDNSKYNTNNSFKLSVISTIVSGVSVVTSLIIALVR